MLEFRDCSALLQSKLLLSRHINLLLSLKIKFRIFIHSISILYPLMFLCFHKSKLENELCANMKTEVRIFRINSIMRLFLVSVFDFFSEIYLYG